MTERRFGSGHLERDSPEAILYDGLAQVEQSLREHLEAQDRVLQDLGSRLVRLEQQVNWLVMKLQ